MRAWAAFLSVASAVLAVRGDSGKRVAVKEVDFDSSVSDIQWLGHDHKTVLVQTSRGRLYRSTTGGDQWSDITDQLRVDATNAESPPITVEQIIKSPADRNTVLVVGAQQSHYISTTGGATWRRVRQKAAIHTFIFHSKRPRWALLSTWTEGCEPSKKQEGQEGEEEEDESPCNHMLYLTKDLGKTFTLVSSYVVQFSWGDRSVGHQDRIYFTHFRQKRGDQPKLYIWSQNVDFSYTDDGGRSVERLVHRGNKFLVSNNFIFVAKLKDAEAQTVNLMVSNDGGATFRLAKLPLELEEKSYTILDTSEGAVMLHVNHGSKEPPHNLGNVYISDQEGVRFALSLPNNLRSSSGSCEFDKVLSLEGVYIANFKDTPKSGDGESVDKDAVANRKAEEVAEAEELEESASGSQVDRSHEANARTKEESVVRTVISFDKGGVWSYLKPPRVDSIGQKIDCPPDRCWLHLHGVTNFHNYAPFYSTENAVGIVMGTGNVGPYLRFEPDQTNTYLSRDGGLTWVEAHKGAFIYEFGDHGGLLVMADDIRKTKQVVFSWNEGHSWYDFELSDVGLEVDNVVTEPNATSTKFLLYGTRGDAGVMFHLDFEALGQPICKGVWAADSVSSDYETWQPSDGRSTEKCLLGRQVTYTRRKQTSECFNGETFERPVNRKNCACTEEDFECEMGFTRKVGSFECKYANDGSVQVPQKCTSSDYFFVDSHRKVIGDTCEGGWQPQRAAVPCPAGSKMSKGAVSVLATVAIIGGIMAFVTCLSKSERFKGIFANYGFESYNDVKYSTIGARAPETALDSVGAQYESGFIEGDQDDDFDEDAPQLMAYTAAGSGGRDGDRDRDRDRDRSRDRDRDRDRDEEARPEVVRRIDTAAAQVPKLQKPPGSAALVSADDDNDVDLL